MSLLTSSFSRELHFFNFWLLLNDYWTISLRWIEDHRQLKHSVLPCLLFGKLIWRFFFKDAQMIQRHIRQPRSQITAAALTQHRRLITVALQTATSRENLLLLQRLFAVSPPHHFCVQTSLWWDRNSTISIISHKQTGDFHFQTQMQSDWFSLIKQLLCFEVLFIATMKAEEHFGVAKKSSCGMNKT